MYLRLPGCPGVGRLHDVIAGVRDGVELDQDVGHDSVVGHCINDGYCQGFFHQSSLDGHVIIHGSSHNLIK